VADREGRPPAPVGTTGLGVLEGEQQADANGAIRAGLHEWVCETGKFRNHTGVVDKRIDVVVLDMVEDVLGIEMHLEIHSTYSRC